MNGTVDERYKDPSLQPASTVILLRDDTGGGFEVFLLKRHEKSRFMGGSFVYPGGTVDKRDKGRDILSAFVFDEYSSDKHPALISSEFYVAAIRELFEEAGILLAERDGALLDFTDPDIAGRFNEYRRSLSCHNISLSDMAEKEHLKIRADMLTFYARWITPVARPVRFDACFFIAPCPRGQHPSPDYSETVDGIWTGPKDALMRNETGEITLSPPIIKTLEDLAAIRNIREAGLITTDPGLMPIVPVLVRIGGELVILFPWNDDYPLYIKDGAADYGDYRWPSRYVSSTDRIVERNGRWYPVKRPTPSL